MIHTSSEQQKKEKKKSEISVELAKKITLNGDRLAGDEFVRLNYRWLLFVVRRKFRRSNNHEDIVQDAFMLVIDKLQTGSIADINAVMAYLHSTAINIGFEYFRKDKKFTSAIASDLLEVIEDVKEDVLSSMIWNDKIAYIKKAMTGLKIQRDRDILIKYYFEDRGKRSICKDLALSSEHFDRVLYRAKDRLKQIIMKDNNHDNPNGTIKSLNKSQVKDKAKNKNSSHNIKLKIFNYIITVLQKIIKPMRLFA